MTRSLLFACLLQAASPAVAAPFLAAPGKGKEAMPLDLGESLQRILAGKASREAVRIEMHLSPQGGQVGKLAPCSLWLYGSGTGVWQSEKQLTLDRDEVVRLLEQFRDVKFPSLPATLGESGDDPRLGRPVALSSRITLTIGEATRTVTQLPAGEQSEPFARLAAALRRAAEGAVRRNGKGCESLDQGLKMVAGGALAPETFSGHLLTYKLGEGGQGANGWQLSWAGGDLVAGLIVKGAPASEQRRRATPGQLRELAEALREEGLARLPLHVHHEATVHLNARVLNRGHGLQAHPLPAYKEKATPEDQKRLARLVERLRAVHAGVMKPGEKAPATKESAKPGGCELKVLARGAWPHVPVHAPQAAPRRQQQMVFRSEEQLTRAAGEHALTAVARALKVGRIDFDKQMLVAVSDGTLPMVGVSGGGPPSVPYRIELPRVERDGEGKGLTVFWRLAPRDPAAPIISYPLAAALVERSEGEVRFVKLPTAGAPGAGKDEPTGKAPGGREVKVLARAFWPDGWKAERPAQQWVVRSYQELIDPRLKAPEPVLERMRQENAARYARALGVKAVDFDRHMIIGVSGGVQPSGGYRVEVARVEKGPDGKALTVAWRLHAPRPGEAVTPELTHPAEVVLVEQHPGPVRFERIQK